MNNAVKTVSEDELYWAVLEVPSVVPPGTQVLKHTLELDEAFTDFLPVPIDTVKPAYVSLGAAPSRGGVLAAAVPRDRLAALTERDTTVIVPATIPADLLPTSATLDQSACLNFLWGDLEAKPVVIAKRRAALAAAGVIAALAAAALLGLERRTAALHAATTREQSLAATTLKDLYRKPTLEAGAAALDQELSRLTRTRAQRAGVPADAADALQLVLTAWPRPHDTGPQSPESKPPKLRTESLTATPDNLTLSVAIESREQAAPLSDALRAIPRWKFFQPQFVASPGQGATPGSGGMLSLHLAFDTTGEKPAEGGAQ